MALTYGFYNSLNGDRRYNAEQMSEIFDGILIDGIIPSIGQLFVVKTANNRMQITVGTGRAWFDHTWTKNDAVMILVVTASDVTRPRYDAVVLEVNHETRINSIKLVKGEPAVNAVKPILVNNDKVHQYPLAYVLVRAGTSEIKASDIENTVGRSPTPFATGVLETAPLDDLWNQWKGEFTDWFDNIKAQLSGNIATNLQNQINAVRDSIPAKATANEALIGSNDTKFITPSTLKKTIDSNRIYMTDNNGTTYTWKARDVLPMVNNIGQSEIDYYSVTMGYVVRLANYEVLHYLDKIWVFDKAGSVRNYSVAANLDHPHSSSNSSLIGNNFGDNTLVTNRAMAIRGTNSYFAFTPTSLYKITVGTSTPKVELYYTWPSTDGIPVALSYINSEWSGLILTMTGQKFRIFKVSNSYVAQPTIYTIDLASSMGTYYGGQRIVGIAGRYAIYIATGSSSGRSYAIADVLTGTLVNSGSTFPLLISDVRYCFVDDVHGIFNICSEDTLYSFSSTSTSYSSHSMIPSGGSRAVISVEGYPIDVSNGVYYATVAVTYSSSDDHPVWSYYIARYQYIGSFRMSLYTIPPNIPRTGIQHMNGSTGFVSCQYVSGGSETLSHTLSYPIVPANMSGSMKFLEVYPAFLPTNGSQASSIAIVKYPLPIPRLMIYERFIYCFPIDSGLGLAKYDMQARTFIGVPI